MRFKVFTTRIIFLSVLTCLFAYASSQNKSENTPWFFIQITDPQMGMYENNEGFGKETALLEKAITGINQLRPDFVVFTGDFVHDKNSPQQIEGFKKLMAKIDPAIRVYYTPGNHDLGQNPGKQSLKLFRQNYGKVRFAFLHKGSAFIGFNSSCLKDRQVKQEHEQFNWIAGKLRKYSQADHRILFCHYPFFNSTPEEPESYSNIAPDHRKKYLSLLMDSRVDAVFSGHLHSNREFSYNKTMLVTTSALGKPLGSDPSGLRIIKIYNNRIEHHYYGLDELPDSVTF
jgi:serine/threonine-protein phosphatase CPPED1